MTAQRAPMRLAGFRRIQRTAAFGDGGAPNEPTGATEVTLATAPATMTTAETPVARGFIGTAVLSLGRI
jgi:hypothetical protein